VLIVLRSDDNNGLLPANVPERALWTIWGGVVLADAALCVGLRIYTGDYVTAFHLTFAILPFLAGVGFCAMSTEFSARNLLMGLAWFVSGMVILSFVPVPWAVLAYIVVNTLCVLLKVAEIRLDRQLRSRPVSMTSQV
jgi:hypothetical protein